MKEEVVAVEESHSCADRLEREKTNQHVGPGPQQLQSACCLPQRTPATGRCPWRRTSLVTVHNCTPSKLWELQEHDKVHRRGRVCVMREWNPEPKEGRSFTCMQRPELKSLPQLGIGHGGACL